MRRYQFSSLLLSGAVAIMMILAVPASVRAQGKTQAAQDKTEKFDLALTFNPVYSGVITNNSFWMEGGAAQAQLQISRHWGAVFEVSGLHTSNMHSSGVGLDLVNYVIGPRFTWRPRQEPKLKYELFGQGMAGAAHGMNSVFPGENNYTTTSTQLATEMGGGVNVELTPHLWLRAAEVDWLFTGMPNSYTNAQNNLKMGFGLVFKFK